MCHTNNYNEFLENFDVLLICEEIKNKSCIENILEILNGLKNKNKFSWQKNELIILAITKCEQTKDQNLV